MSSHDAQVLLASASPRRRRLIAWLGITTDVTATDTDEYLDPALSATPHLLAERLATEKALAARAEAEGRIVLSFDTIVAVSGELLGKPEDTDDAWRMLRTLSGRVHSVVTGVAVLSPGGAHADTFSVATPVKMRDLTDADLEVWIADGECMGCAGAYNIERHLASVSINDCYQNVAGLPLCHLYAEMAARHQLDGLTEPARACNEALGRSCTLGRRICART